MQGYDPRAYPPAAITVDLVVLTIRQGQLTALVVRRGEPPFEGRLALPGGFVRPDEGLGQAAARELTEETHLPANSVHLEQLASYGDPHRDPRMRVVTVAYLALAPSLPTPQAGTDAADASWAPTDALLAPVPTEPTMPAGRAGSARRAGPAGPGPAGSARPAGSADRAGPAGLAFDHRQILTDGVERARAKLEYTSLAAAFCPPRFTVGQLRRVYEIVWGAGLDPRNFHRKATSTPGFLTPTGSATTGERGRPAQLYRQGPATQLHPPLLRAPVTTH